MILLPKRQSSMNLRKLHDCAKHIVPPYEGSILTFTHLIFFIFFSLNKFGFLKYHSVIALRSVFETE